MSEHPETIRGESGGDGAIHWDDSATLHRADDGAGVLYAFKAVRAGTLRELVRFVTTLPEPERARYVIEKAGDHRLTPGEIASLARRADFAG